MKRFLTTTLLATLFWACSESAPDSAGATSETTNGIAFTVVDVDHKPIANARLTLYSKADISVQGTAETDTLGKAHFDTLILDTYIEGIAGADSSLMAWTTLDTNQNEISLLPSASLTVRTGVAETDFAMLHEAIAFQSTPYVATRNGSDYVFAHVPAGMFTVVAGDSAVATFSLEAGAEADTLVNVPGKTLEYVFEDFDDGDSLNNLAKTYKNYGWYYIASGTATWVKPDSAGGFGGAIVDGARGKHLSLQFDLGDSGYVLLGTHLGLDTGYYDLSSLTAIRMKVRGDCDFSFALEHYKDLGDNNFQKSLWHATADTTWKEFVFRPGREKLNASVYQVEWKGIAHEIGFMSIFASSGSFLEIDEIVFEGIGSI